MKRKSFVFYDGFYNAIKKMRSNDEKAELIEAICKYEFEGEIPEMSYVCEVAFEVIKPSLDSAASRYDASVENGKKGGRPPKNKNLEKPNETYNNLEEPKITKQNQTEPTHNHNDNVNDNVNGNANENVNISNSKELEAKAPVSENKSISSENKKGRKSLKDQLVEYVNSLDYEQETKDILLKWIFNIGLERNVRLQQLQDMLKNIWQECNDELLVREAINNSYLHNYVGFYKPRERKTFIDTNKTVTTSAPPRKTNESYQMSHEELREIMNKIKK